MVVIVTPGWDCEIWLRLSHLGGLVRLSNVVDIVTPG